MRITVTPFVAIERGACQVFVVNQSIKHNPSNVDDDQYQGNTGKNLILGAGCCIQRHC